MNILRILRTCIILLSIVYLTSYNIALGLTSLLIYICLQGNHGIDGFRNSLIDLRMGEQSIETPYTVGKQKKDKDKVHGYLSYIILASRSLYFNFTWFWYD